MFQTTLALRKQRKALKEIKKALTTRQFNYHAAIVRICALLGGLTHGQRKAYYSAITPLVPVKLRSYLHFTRMTPADRREVATSMADAMEWLTGADNETTLEMLSSEIDSEIELGYSRCLLGCHIYRLPEGRLLASEQQLFKGVLDSVVVRFDYVLNTAEARTWAKEI